MSEAISSIGGALGGGAGGGLPTFMKLILGGLTGAGEIGNIMADRQRADLLNKEKANMNLTPQQLSAKVAAATKPLDLGLTQSVGNQVQGMAAERGLAEAPGIFQGMLAQSLAPYYQKNQDDALNLILSQLGIPSRAGSLVPGQTNLSPMLALLIRSMQNGGGGSSGGGAPFPQPLAFPDLNPTDISAIYGGPSSISTSTSDVSGGV